MNPDSSPTPRPDGPHRRSAPVRIGAVAYLNTRPLVFGMERGLGGDRLELSYQVPARLADGMREGRLDVALMPVVELANQPALELVPGIAIATRGPARSVLLVSRVPPGEITSVALDPESRTSNALAQVLFDRVWRRRPRFAVGPGSLDAALDEHDAAVRIGDKALFEPLPAGAHVEDLGGVWTAETGLPFVFAAWFARPGVVDRDLYRILHESKRRGVREIDRIAEEYSWRGTRDPAAARDYLGRHIRYALGGAEIQAMRAFFEAAASIGLIGAVPEIRLALARTTRCHEVARAIQPAGRRDSAE